jgi:hypothetical protein
VTSRAKQEFENFRVKKPPVFDLIRVSSAQLKPRPLYIKNQTITEKSWWAVSTSNRFSRHWEEHAERNLLRLQEEVATGMTFDYEGE